MCNLLYLPNDFKITLVKGVFITLSPNVVFDFCSNWLYTKFQISFMLLFVSKAAFML